MYENPVLNEAAPKEVPGIAFQSGVKWYINLGKMAEYFNNGMTSI